MIREALPQRNRRKPHAFPPPTEKKNDAIRLLLAHLRFAQRRAQFRRKYTAPTGLLSTATVGRGGRSRAPAEGVDRIQRCDYNVITSRRWNVIKTRLVQIGNSRGVRLPKPVIEEAGLSDEVELQVRDGAVVIRSLRAPRSGWAEAARALRGSGADVLLDPPTPTRFDEEEWEW